MRENALRYWLRKVNEEAEQMAAPLEDTRYPTEVEGFWDDLRKAMKIKDQAQRS